MKSFIQYWNKLRGRGNAPIPSMQEIVWSAIGAFVGIYTIEMVSYFQPLPFTDKLFLIGSFGASAVLLYGVPQSPYAQPRNLLLGHCLSALVGVMCAEWLGFNSALAAALAVSLALTLMHLTQSIHPPGGATALIAVMGSEKIHQLSYGYIFSPVLLGVIILLLVALLVNNLSLHRRYPEYWW